eukprot:SAG11_NODE_12603_length_695_cov_0.771812_1_plen_24_part_10
MRKSRERSAVRKRKEIEVQTPRTV